MNTISSSLKICVIGLGYVGLPLAVSLAKHFKVTGFDINETRIQELKNHYDRTWEIDEARLQASSLNVSYTLDDIKAQDIYIVTVPTPVDHRNQPDLMAVLKASEMVGKVMQK
ncbi:MAG: hypothetical protein Q8K37_00790, partial [Alphaproteobacteria bacterium]|nr:hypothetical protein [Alphaproteobacteria bacterium]